MFEKLIHWATSEKRETKLVLRFLFWISCGSFIFYDQFLARESSRPGEFLRHSHFYFLNFFGIFISIFICYYLLSIFVKLAFSKSQLLYVVAGFLGVLLISESYIYYSHQYFSSLYLKTLFNSRYNVMGDLKFPQLLFDKKVFSITLMLQLYYLFIVLCFKLSVQILVYVYSNEHLKAHNLNLKLKALRTQVNPDFLFKTLDKISTLVKEEEKGSEAVRKLSSLMQYSFNKANKEKALLREEIAFIEDYMSLENLRLDMEKVKVGYTLSGEPRNFTIPPLVLLCFVENAYKHGVRVSKDNSWINVSIDISDDNLVFVVENSLSESAKQTSLNIQGGISLKNAQKRLATYYPNGGHTLEVTPTANTYKVRLEMDLG